MTEDEAREKWCPFARAGSGQSGNGSMNRDAFPTPADPALVERHTRCMASACMAWRWGDAKREPATVTEIAAHMRENGVGPLDAAAATARSVEHGFCGLAGEMAMGVKA